MGPRRLTGVKPGVQYTVLVWATRGGGSSNEVSTEAETGFQSKPKLRVRTLVCGDLLMRYLQTLIKQVKMDVFSNSGSF